MNRRMRRSSGHACREQARDDVTADVCAERRERHGGSARVTRTPKSVARAAGSTRPVMMNGAIDSGSVDAECDLQHRHVARDDDLVDLFARTPACSHTSPASSSSVSCARVLRVLESCPVEHRGRDARDDVGAERLCLFSIERTASGTPVATSSRFATTVVVPRSNASAKRRSVVSPGSTVEKLLVADHGCDLEVGLAQRAPSVRATASGTCSSRSSIAARTRSMSDA